MDVSKEYSSRSLQRERLSNVNRLQMNKLACLRSCWCYVAHVGQRDGCQDGHLGDHECQDGPRWRLRGCKIELRWHPGLEIGSFYINLGDIFDAF